MNSPLILPIITVQPSFATVIEDVQSGSLPTDSFWISCYKASASSVHAKVNVSLDEIERDTVRFEPEGEVQIRSHTSGSETSYFVSCPALEIPETKILLPKQEYSDPERSNPQHPHKILAFDISPDSSQFATGFHDGSVHIYPLTPGNTASAKSMSKAHLSSVTSLRFFPSSRVLLTAGLDFGLNILPADTQPSDSLPDNNNVNRIQPVRTLRGHTRSITDIAIVSRGRNILSCSTDGTVKLWDVGSGQQIHSFTTGGGRYVPIESMSLGERGEGEAGRKPPDGEDLNESESGGNLALPAADEREVDTADKMVYCALQDGSVETFDLASRRMVHRLDVFAATPGIKSSLSAITYSPTHSILAVGSGQGRVTVYDTRNLAAPLTFFSRNTARIEDLLLTRRHLTAGSQSVGDDVELLIATEDGLPYIASIRPEGPGVLAELVGGDCEGVRTVRAGLDGQMWTASDDGIVRRY